jgi:hypothetical protein
MAQFKASLTEGPSFNTSDPVGSTKRFAKYTVGVGIMAVGLSLGFGVVKPLIDMGLNKVSGGRINSSDDPLGGVWGDI